MAVEPQPTLPLSQTLEAIGSRLHLTKTNIDYLTQLQADRPEITDPQQAFYYIAEAWQQMGLWQNTDIINALTFRLPDRDLEYKGYMYRPKKNCLIMPNRQVHLTPLEDLLFHRLFYHRAAMESPFVPMQLLVELIDDNIGAFRSNMNRLRQKIGDRSISRNSHHSYWTYINRYPQDKIVPLNETTYAFDVPDCSTT